MIIISKKSPVIFAQYGKYGKSLSLFWSKYIHRLFYQILRRKDFHLYMYIYLKSN